jgi:hypothetical protein
VVNVAVIVMTVMTVMTVMLVRESGTASYA